MMDAPVAKILLEASAVVLRPDDLFTWSSGIKSPIYVDNRLLLSDVHAREAVLKGMQKKYWSQNTLPFNGVAATATAGIAWGAILADKFSVPLVYVRAKAKSHGKEGLIEGKVCRGLKYVVVEDLISTGASAIKTAQAVRDAGGVVTNCLSIFTYGLKKSKQNLKEAEIRLTSVVTLDVLLSTAVKFKYITLQQRTFIRQWRSYLDINKE